MATEVITSAPAVQTVWWQDASLFVYFHIYDIHTFIQSQYIYPSQFAEASLHFLIASKLSGENFPVVPSRKSNNTNGAAYSTGLYFRLLKL
jgi:hypothetical protein